MKIFDTFDEYADPCIYATVDPVAFRKAIAKCHQCGREAQAEMKRLGEAARAATEKMEEFHAKMDKAFRPV